MAAAPFVVEGAHGLGRGIGRLLIAAGARVLDAQADRHQGL
jgi:hypothetical protein